MGRGKVRKRKSTEGKDEGRRESERKGREKEGRMSRESKGLGRGREKERLGREGKWREGGK